MLRVGGYLVRTTDVLTSPVKIVVIHFMQMTVLIIKDNQPCTWWIAGSQRESALGMSFVLMLYVTLWLLTMSSTSTHPPHSLPSKRMSPENSINYNLFQRMSSMNAFITNETRNSCFLHSYSTTQRIEAVTVTGCKCNFLCFSRFSTSWMDLRDMDEDARCVFYVEKWENVVVSGSHISLYCNQCRLLFVNFSYSLSRPRSSFLFLYYFWKLWCIFLIYTAVININHNLSRCPSSLSSFFFFGTSELCKYFYAVFMYSFG